MEYLQYFRIASFSFNFRFHLKTTYLSDLDKGLV